MCAGALRDRQEVQRGAVSCPRASMGVMTEVGRPPRLWVPVPGSLSSPHTSQRQIWKNGWRNPRSEGSLEGCETHQTKISSTAYFLVLPTVKSPSSVFPSFVSSSPPTTCLIPFPLAATDVFQCKLDQMIPSLTPLPDVYLNLACGAFIPEPVLAFWIWSDKACHAVSPQQSSLLCQELSSPLCPLNLWTIALASS